MLRSAHAPHTPHTLRSFSGLPLTNPPHSLHSLLTVAEQVVWETRKIFGLPDLAVSCTAVRVPTLRAHAEAIVVETEKDVTPDQAREILAAAPGVEVVDDPAALVYVSVYFSIGSTHIQICVYFQWLAIVVT